MGACNVCAVLQKLMQMMQFTLSKIPGRNEMPGSTALLNAIDFIKIWCDKNVTAGCICVYKRDGGFGFARAHDGVAYFDFHG